MKIQDLFQKDIKRHFEGVIKADDQEHLLLELEEYVVTNEISDKLNDFFDAYNSSGGSNGVWLSGFFGSGKSHLLKILSYLLENREVDGQKPIDIFLPKIEDAILKGEIQKALRIPAQSILFNIDQKSDTQSSKQSDAVLSVFMKVFNEMLGYYPKHGFVAEMEHGLHKKGIYDAFKTRYAELTGESWEEGRDSLFLEADNFAQALSEVGDMSITEASKVLDRYEREYSLTIEHFAHRVKEWLDTQAPGFRLNFFIDEIGQFISDNTKLMLNLQTIVESLATICNGQAWVIVTSQENVDEILGDMSARQNNDFSRIQDRFSTKIMLTSANADEVIQKRLLSKKQEAMPALEKLYEREGNNLKTLFRFGGGSRTYKSFSDERHFVNCYPFLPYQFELFHAASTGLSRQRAFTGRHKSVGERSMLDVFRQVAIQHSADEVETLMSFDSMFAGLQPTIRSQFRNGITTAENNLGDPFALRVLKALFLVKYIKEFKATTQNIAALLVTNMQHDLPAHEKKVQEALNRLEQESYVQRTEDAYEYLTDEEKDIEEAIKSVELDDLAISDLLARMIFDEVLADSRIRYEVNKQDYPFSKMLDGRLKGQEQSLGIQVISPLHEAYEQQDALAAQTMGKAELLFIMAEDKRLIQDLRLFLQTSKYTQRENKSTLPDSRKRILMEKQIQNNQRRQHIAKRVELCLERSACFLNGNALDLNPTKAKVRMRTAFQQLVPYAYSRLSELKTTYREEDIRATVLQRHDDLFAGDEAALSPPEQEVLTRLRRNKTRAERTPIRKMLDDLQGRPYGWPQTAILVLLARLYKRGMIELRRDNMLLEDKDVLESLSNNRQYKQTYLSEVESVDPAKLRALRDFYQDFFHEACPEQEAKAAALALRERLATTAKALKEHLRNTSNYPFLKALTPIQQRVEELQGKSYEFFLKELSSFEDELLDAREDLLDPIEQFMSGDQRKIYDELRQFLQKGETNLSYLPDVEVMPLREALEDEQPYRGGRMQQAKKDLDAAKNQLLKLIEAEQQTAQERLQERIDQLKSDTDFEKISDHQQQQVIQPLEELANRIAASRNIPQIRDLINREADKKYRDGLGKMVIWAKPKPEPKPLTGGDKHMPPKDPEPTFRMINPISLRVKFHKNYLQSEADVEAYLEALKKRYLEVIEKGDRISL